MLVFVNTFILFTRHSTSISFLCYTSLTLCHLPTSSSSLDTTSMSGLSYPHLTLPHYPSTYLISPGLAPPTRISSLSSIMESLESLTGFTLILPSTQPVSLAVRKLISSPVPITPCIFTCRILVTLIT